MGVALLDSLLGGATPLAPVRREAVAALLRDGLPGQRDEPWKYTSLRALARQSFQPGDAAAASRAIPAEFLAHVPGPRLVFVNGAHRADLSQMPVAEGLDLRTFAEAPAELAELLAEPEATTRSDAFLRLNTALVTDGLRLRVAAGQAVEAPLHLIFIGAAAEAELAWQLRLDLELGAGARLHLVEHHLGAGRAPHLGNVVSRARLGEGARLDVAQMQEAGEDAVLLRRHHYHLDAEATLAMATLESGAATTRHELAVELAGRAARFESRGVFALRGRQHCDIHMDVEHAGRDTVSDVVWHGVAEERSRGVFHGAITILAGADGSDAALANKNLLLSAQAEIDTKPALVIYADEVKAVHGATVGQLDEHALFYLRSRGIPEEEARRILVAAFCSAVFAGLEPEATRRELEERLATRVPLAAEE